MHDALPWWPGTAAMVAAQGGEAKPANKGRTSSGHARRSEDDEPPSPLAACEARADNLHRQLVSERLGKPVRHNRQPTRIAAYSRQRLRRPHAVVGRCVFPG